MIQGETLLRVAAVGGAVALLASPYAAQFATLARRAFVLVRTHWTLAARVTAAALIIAAAWGRIPLPAVPTAVPMVVVETPTRELQTLVAPISKTLSRLPVAERAAWMSVWSKAAAVVENPGAGETRIFADIPALRLFTVVALDIAWRRLGGCERRLKTRARGHESPRNQPPRARPHPRPGPRRDRGVLFRGRVRTRAGRRRHSRNESIDGVRP